MKHSIAAEESVVEVKCCFTARDCPPPLGHAAWHEWRMQWREAPAVP
jgi:hypothetical protein